MLADVEGVLDQLAAKPLVQLSGAVTDGSRLAGPSCSVFPVQVVLTMLKSVAFGPAIDETPSDTGPKSAGTPPKPVTTILNVFVLLLPSFTEPKFMAGTVSLGRQVCTNASV